MRLFGGPKRDKRPADDPPPWLLPLGAGGLAVGLIGRSVGGPVGEGCADLGCAATALGAFAFFGLLLEWRSSRNHKG